MSLMIDDTLTKDDAIEAGRIQRVGWQEREVNGSAALEAFVVEHYDRLLRLARLVCQDAIEASDAVQAGLEQAWRHRGDLRDDDRRGAWLDRIVVREAIRVRRRHRTWWQRIVGLDAEGAVFQIPHDPSPDLTIRLAINGAFDRLSAEQRAAVSLHLYAGYSVAETAVIVGAPVETVRSRLRLARERMRDALGERVP
jgi:RNA polymerase sigma-70 factor, ECF subfamily